jgi:hypothetical protein
MTVAQKTGYFVFIIAILLLFLFFPSVMLHPNSNLFSIQGDGIKNYFSFLYYLQNNHGLHFTGMNYPYGEHLAFADGQPALAVPFQLLSQLFPAIKNYGVAIINLSALLSFAAGAFIFYKILLHYRVQFLFAAAGALLIVFFSPQLFRLQAHYALSYVCFFPATWYFFIKLNQGKQVLKWGCSIALCLLLSGLLHFYMAALSAFFLLCCTLLKTIFAFKKTSSNVLLLSWLSPMVALLLLTLFMKVTDTVTDRPSHPWGFFHAMADWTTVFLPHPTDLFGNANRTLPGFSEGFAYVGLVPLAALIFILLRFVINTFRFRWRYLLNRATTDQSLFLLSAIPVLLFSMCIPFIWGMESLVDHLSFLRQFRALGRFAWVFYYVAGVEAVSYIYRCFRLYRQHQLKRTAFVLAGICLLLWTAETHVRIKEVNKLVGNTASKYHAFNDANFSRLLGESGHFTSDFQAILSFPFFHQGSEQFSIEHGSSQVNALQAAYQLNIPIVNVMMSRTSLQQSCDVLQLLSDTLIDKKIVQHFTSKPFLLITSGNSFSEQENYLIKKAQLLKDAGELKLYLLPVNAFEAAKINVQERFNATIPDTGFVVRKFYSNEQLPLTLFQKNSSGDTILFEGELPGISESDTLELGLWVKIDLQLEALPFVQFERRTSDAYVVQTENYFFKHQTNVYGQCILLKQEIVVAAKDRITLRLIGKGSFSNLLIRKKNSDVFQSIGSFGFYFNNIPVKKL